MLELTKLDAPLRHEKFLKENEHFLFIYMVVAVPVDVLVNRDDLIVLQRRVRHLLEVRFVVVEVEHLALLDPVQDPDLFNFREHLDFDGDLSLAVNWLPKNLTLELTVVQKLGVEGLAAVLVVRWC